MAALQHDARGFLVGERLISGVDLIGRDTTEILKILKGASVLKPSNSNRDRVSRDRLGHAVNDHAADIVPRQSLSPRGTANRRPLPTADIGAPSDNNRPIPPTREYGDPAPDNGGNGSGNPAPTPSPTIDPPMPPTGDIEPPMPQNGDIEPPTTEGDGRRNNGRRRNARGQFEGDGLTDEERKRKAEEAAKAKAEKEANDNLKKSIMEGISLGNADTRNIDPTVDAVRELSDLMSPLAKVGKTMFKGAAWLFRRKKKREAPSDQEQRQQTRIEKLLKRIAGSRVGAAARSGSNLLSGIGGGLSSLFGMGGNLLSGLAPLLMRALVPALGLTAAFKFGEWIGGKIYDFIEPALSPLIDGIAAIPDKMAKAWQGVIDIASRGIEAVVDTVKGIKNKVTGAYDTARNYLADGMTNLAERFKGDTKPQASFTPDKAKAIQATADRLGVNPNDLAQIISFESAGSFDPAKKNMGGSGATGLIQFMPDTAKGMGTTTDDLAKMSFEQQMAYVEKYFVGRGIGKNGKTSLADMYNAVQGVPASGYKAGTQAYAQNKAWDVNGDGVIMPNEAVQGAGFKAHAKNYFPSTDVSKVTAASPTMPTVNSMVNAPLDFLTGGVVSTASTKTFAPPIPMAAPKLLARPMPEIPKQKQQVSTKDQKPMQVSVVGGNEAIGQNLSDRHLAHAVTGGLGMDSLRHG